MPDGLAEDIADTLTLLYRGVQTRLAVEVARRLGAGVEAPSWAADKLLAIGSLQRWTHGIVGGLDTTMVGAVERGIMAAYTRGGAAAIREVNDAGVPRGLVANLGRALTGAGAEQALPGNGALLRLATSLVTGLRGTHAQLLRWPLDAYRQVIATATAPDVILGTQTRRQAAQRGWQTLLDRGVTGFRDRGGRNWELASYVEMSSRSTVGQAVTEGHLDRLADAGIDLVQVSDSPHECERCRPWEGKILARSGPAGRRTIQVEHATQDGAMVTVEIAGTVDEAIQAGLHHPNCTHSFGAYVPGVTKRKKATANPQGDADRQRLRAMERNLRTWKLREAAAIDPAAAEQAKAKVKEWQARIREHCATTSAKRQPQRELIGVAR
jgi:hypothetical protein